MLNKILKFCFFVGFLITPSLLPALNGVKTYSFDFFAGPEVYHVKRIKEGGAQQNGTLYGARIGYERVRRYKIYWGADALWAKGKLTGGVRDQRLKSEFTDSNIEARIGYTFQSKYWRCASFTPFIGVGYFCEKNCYQDPSPLKVHFKNTFGYVPIGFLSQIFITPTISIGLNFKVRVIWEGKQHVSHDPEHGKMTQHYNEKPQYRIELPFTYFFNWGSSPLGVSLVPFYEYRNYGHRANFPFDFLETKFKLYGATLKLLYLF